jgi:DNA modification methylase
MSPEFEIHNTDCIPWMLDAAKDGRQFDLMVYSPPFASLYAYSNLPADMGNSRESDGEFLLHFEFFANAIFPLLKPGRNMCVHIQNPARSMSAHGRPGIWDMRGDCIKLFERAGFWYYGEVTIAKNPQAQSIRTKSLQLQFTQFIKDSMVSRPALNDYLLIFKAPGKNEVPVTSEKQTNDHGALERKDVNNSTWIDWAWGTWGTDEQGMLLPYPIWEGIRETKTLNERAARKEEDQRHLCPLQLDLIERCVRLWSNPGETVFTPFLGIGSEAYTALHWDRKAIGTEIKDEYFACAQKNCTEAIQERNAARQQIGMVLA